MIVKAEIDGNGIVKVKDQNLWGKQISLSLANGTESEFALETDWDAVKAVFRKADSLDFPRKSHEQILRDLHDMKG